jgi:hypothetical protein
MHRKQMDLDEAAHEEGHGLIECERHFRVFDFDRHLIFFLFRSEDAPIFHCSKRTDRTSEREGCPLLYGVVIASRMPLSGLRLQYRWLASIPVFISALLESLPMGGQSRINDTKDIRD